MKILVPILILALTTVKAQQQEADCKDKFVAEVDFIYWLAKQEGNDYAATGTAVVVPGTTNAGNSFVAPSSLGGTGKVYAPKEKMSPGFKVGIGTDLAHGCWDLLAEYTWLFNKTSSAVTSSNQNARAIA